MLSYHAVILIFMYDVGLYATSIVVTSMVYYVFDSLLNIVE